MVSFLKLSSYQTYLPRTLRSNVLLPHLAANTYGLITYLLTEYYTK
jgi:hypothetical protein